MYGSQQPRRKVRRKKPSGPVTPEGHYRPSPGRQDFYAPDSTRDKAIARRKKHKDPGIIHNPYWKHRRA